MRVLRAAVSSLAFILAAATLPACAQSGSGTAPAAQTEGAVSPEVRAAGLALVEASGARQRMIAAMPATLESSRKSMKDQCPTCSDAFFDEWKKRMATRLNVDAFVDVIADEYERHFTLAELQELTAIVRASSAGKPETPSEALQAKMKAVLPDLMSDTIGRCAKLGALEGGKVGEEIGKEHPDWLHAAPADAAPKS